ncbi:hypothetical protein CRG98_029522 [Punica granatum]|uniref:Uncharacterized protein n=1 Tax=Punica granatum TaxID=22663 RepID=A0A2I0J1G9_PUNGR|nr:hypothetical protein CRG98_029522 [Punica granatum]
MNNGRRAGSIGKIEESRLSGPAPLTSRRPPKTGLQAPRDQRGHGTSFRRPFGTLRGSPKDVSVVANALDEPSGHIHGKRGPQRFPNTSRHLGNAEKNPVTSPKASPGQRSPAEGDEPMIPHGAEGSPKRMSRSTKSNRGPRGTKLYSERPNMAKPTLEALSRPNVRSHDVRRY